VREFLGLPIVPPSPSLLFTIMLYVFPLGRFSAAHRNFLGVRCVPISATCNTLFSVSYGEARRRYDFSEAGMCRSCLFSRERGWPLLRAADNFQPSNCWIVHPLYQCFMKDFVSYIPPASISIVHSWRFTPSSASALMTVFNR
jgi:hypothetical protein